MLQVSQKRGVKSFELIDTSKEDSSSIFQGHSNNQFLKVLKGEDTMSSKIRYDIDEMIASDDNENVISSHKSRVVSILITLIGLLFIMIILIFSNSL